jgi:predicted nucleotidyltransferase
MFLTKLTKALDKYKIHYAIVGGYAVALHGVARGTIDIDIVISITKESFIKTSEALAAIGLKSKLPVTADMVFQFRKEYVENRNLIAWSFENFKNPSEVVDVILTHDLQKMKTKTVQVAGEKVRIVDITDLIAMKKQSGRPQDLEDIKALKIIQGKTK